MIRAATAAALLAVAAGTARADETGSRTFVVEIGARDAALREDCSRRLSAWWDELTSPDRAPQGWDASRWGPWGLVVRTSGHGFVEERPGLVHVTVSVGAEELRSRADSADAFARSLLDGLRARVAERVAAHDAPARGAAEAERDRAAARVSELTARVGEIEARHGGAPDRRAAVLGERLASVERDAVQTRVDRAVAARRLETARKAVDRAAELATLRAESERAAAAAVPAREDLAEKLRLLERRIDELSRTTPAAEAARAEAFKLEIETVGLEARTTALDAEIAALRRELAAAREDARAHAPLARELGAAEAGLDRARERLRERAEASLARGAAFEVVRAPAPVKEDRR